MNKNKKIAIIGSGISGLTSAYILTKSGHDIHLFEKDSRLGGHTHTTPTKIDGQTYPIDSGFIVFNDWTYPNFIKLLSELNVPTQKTTMSFSAFESEGDFVYSGSSLRGLFANLKHLMSYKFWRMLSDIIRFNRRAIKDFEKGHISADLSLGDYLRMRNYGDWFINHYILPMGSAIWSSSNSDIEHFSAMFFIRFFHNHGLFNLRNRPQWRVVSNGSSSYIDAMQGKLGRIYLNTGIEKISRNSNKISIHTTDDLHCFDEVIFACHSDQALDILGNQATEAEREILSAIPYRANTVSVHTDEKLLPKQMAARSCWNVSLGKSPNDVPMLTYYMNALQGFQSHKAISVSVNCDQQIHKDCLLYQTQYTHPTFTEKGIKAQARHSEISGHFHTHFVGAYWFNGFHEDGVKSAIRVCKMLGAEF